MQVLSSELDISIKFKSEDNYIRQKKNRNQIERWEFYEKYKAKRSILVEKATLFFPSTYIFICMSVNTVHDWYNKYETYTDVTRTKTLTKTTGILIAGSMAGILKLSGNCQWIHKRKYVPIV